MNLNKARDFYSAYYEGSLDAGLTQAFERALETEAEVKAEYEQFVRIMSELKGLNEPIEIPDNLHLLIRDRVDAHILSTEGKSKSGAGFFAWKPLAYGAVAAAAIIGVVMSMTNPQSGGDIDVAGVSPIENSSPSFVMKDGAVRLQFSSKEQNSVTLSNAINGELLASQDLKNNKLDSPLVNNSADSVVIKAEFASGYDAMLIAVPGTVPALDDSGIGNLSEFIKSVSSFYSMPVIIETTDEGFNVSWEFETSNVLSSIEDELDTLGLVAEVREEALWISSR